MISYLMKAKTMTDPLEQLSDASQAKIMLDWYI